MPSSACPTPDACNTIAGRDYLWSLSQRLVPLQRLLRLAFIKLHRLNPQGDTPAMAVTNPTARAPSAANRSTEAQRHTLTTEQKDKLLTAVAALLRNLVQGGPAAFTTDLGEIAQFPVWGSFVSLKRGKHLRSCSGMMGQTVTLQQAVAQASERTIWEDERFPPVSASELEHLEMEVWLLYSPKPVPVRGEDQAKAITLGTHGIQIVRGQSRGLFLPSVATDNNWDVHTFLDRLCMKAGLPPTAWKEDDCDLFTFEGDVFHCRLSKFKGTELPSLRLRSAWES